MNKKQLIVAALATVLSVSGANAASTVSGVTQGGSGSFDVKPGFVSGDVGYRYYDQFDVGVGDIINLIFKGKINGQDRNIDSFINLVQEQIKVNGIVNTMRDGNFHNGHAIFISPNGMVVGASGVLNVGQLSVIAPTQDKFNSLKGNYNNRTKEDIEALNKISDLREPNNTVNYGGNAAVTIDGIVISRGKVDGQAVNGVDIRGSQVSIGGKIVNGVNNAEKIESFDYAENLFTTLVNTEGLSNGSNIVIQSGAGNNNKIVITGNVVNKDKNGMVAITNHGGSGLDIAGIVKSENALKVYNNCVDSNMNISGNLSSGDVMSITNKGGDMYLTSNANLSSGGDLELANHGAGALAIEGTTSSTGKTHVYNETGSEIYIDGSINSNSNEIRIVNRNGKLTFQGGTASGTSVSVRNHGNGGMTLNGDIDASEGILVHNTAGNATLNGNIQLVEEGTIAIRNDGTGKLEITSNIYNEAGNTAIKNTATGGLVFNGTIEGLEGELAINNLAGSAVIKGTINNLGNVGIINKDSGTGLTIDATITTEGDVKIVNSSGNSGMTINGKVDNTGNLYLYNDKGSLYVNGTLKNAEGDLYVASRKDATGVFTSKNSEIINDRGPLAIMNKGKVTDTSLNGMELAGTIENSGGETAINNYSGNMEVTGTIDVVEGNLGIINRAGGGSVNVDATITVDTGDVNIKNYGSGNMTVDGAITHNQRLNVLANDGKLILSGDVTNEGSGLSYFAARANGDGIVVQDTFNATATGQAVAGDKLGGILIKNITGTEGLQFHGSAASEHRQVEIYNKVGSMFVDGTLNGQQAVILNKGTNLTVNDSAVLQGDVNIVNKGDNEATVAEKYQDYFREQLKK